MKRQMIKTATIAVLLIASASAVWAFDGPPGRGRHMGPPPEAIEACKDKSEGAEVEFTNRRGETVKATCEQFDGQLAAMPKDGFRGPRGYGRRMAEDVCKDRAAGDSVEFTNRRGETVRATCKLVAVPEGGFRDRVGTPSDETQR